MKLDDHERSLLQRIGAGLKDVSGPEYDSCGRLIYLGLVEGMQSSFLNRGPQYSYVHVTPLGQAHLTL